VIGFFDIFRVPDHYVFLEYVVVVVVIIVVIFCNVINKFINLVLYCSVHFFVSNDETECVIICVKI